MNIIYKAFSGVTRNGIKGGNSSYWGNSTIALRNIEGAMVLEVSNRVTRTLEIEKSNICSAQAFSTPPYMGVFT